jgi:hypothetical protein
LTFFIIADYGRKSRTFLKKSAQNRGHSFVHFADPEKCGRLALEISLHEFSK